MASASTGFSNANTHINCNCSCGEPVIMLTSHTKRNPGRRFLRCPYFREPRKCCSFFRWVDPGSAMKTGVLSKEESRLKMQEERQLIPLDHDEIVADIGDVVHCVTNLREIQIAEINEIKQKQKATTDELKGEMQHLKEILVLRDVELKEAFAKRDKDLLNLKRIMLIFFAVVVVYVVLNYK